ncbi:MAG: hypothetical protein IPF79_02625 [Ignavibacteria bacterium]|nr:hypothetical protein [Ignavibacteria bacterium]
MDTFVATKQQFSQAISRISKPSESIIRLLRVHDGISGRVATASVLADKVGWQSYRAVNLHYGRLAKRIGSAMDIPEANLNLLVDFVRPEDITNKEWLLVMKPAFAEAIRTLHWI